MIAWRGHAISKHASVDELGGAGAFWWLTVASDAIDLQLSGSKPSVDPDGSEDYGNIDSFGTVADTIWEMEGSWGPFRASRPVVRFQLD